MTWGAPNIAGVRTGCKGEEHEVKFRGMGMALVGYKAIFKNGEKRLIAIVVDLAYCPYEGQSENDIISTNRWMETQGILTDFINRVIIMIIVQCILSQMNLL